MERVFGSACRAAMVLSMVACDAPSEPRVLDGDLTRESGLFITLTKHSWTWDEASGSGVRATLSNLTGRTLISALGDRFNFATEQANLFVSKGSSGSVEWRDASGVWQVAGLAQSIEGVKDITLRQGGTYSLTALLRDTPRAGTYRIRIDYFDAPDGTVRHSDYSPIFEIR